MTPVKTSKGSFLWCKLWAVSSRKTFPHSLCCASSLHQASWIHISRKAKGYLSVFAEANPPRASPAHQSFVLKVTTSRLVNPVDRPHIANALTWHPSGWHAASHPEEEAFRVQLWLLCLCSQTVFPFIPRSAYSVYFGALLHHWGLTEPEKENISLTSNSMTRPLEAASSAFLQLSKRQNGRRVLIQTALEEVWCVFYSMADQTQQIKQRLHTLDWNEVAAFNQTSNNLHNVTEERMTASD